MVVSVQPTNDGAPSVYEMEVALVVPPKAVKAAGVAAPAGITPLHAATLKVGGQVIVGNAFIVKVMSVLGLRQPVRVSTVSA